MADVLNMAAIELNVIYGQCLDRRFDNIEEIKNGVEAWMNTRNSKESKINWQFTTKDARIKLKNFISQLIIDMTLVITQNLRR